MERSGRIRRQVPGMLVVALAVTVGLLGTLGRDRSPVDLGPLDRTSSAPLPFLQLDPVAGPAGSTVRVTGSEFGHLTPPPAGPCTIDPINDPQYTGYLVCVAGAPTVSAQDVQITMERGGVVTPLGRATTDDRGTFTADVTIPFGTPAGPVELVARGDDGRGPAQSVFVVLRPAPEVVIQPALAG